jgi:hypothetical protein
MKKTRMASLHLAPAIFLLAVILFSAANTAAQFDDILKKKLPEVPDWTPGGAVTTSIKDAYPIVPWLDDFDNLEPSPIKNSILVPGYYRDTVQSFCLHAGTYGPTKGEGYLFAPLKGNQAKLIDSICHRYLLYPDIKQEDVQLLLWGIEAGTKFYDYPLDFQVMVRPLLTAEEIAKMNIDLTPAFELVPPELKEAADLYSEMRKRLTDPTSNYEDIEQIAVLNGAPPGLGPGSKIINPGNWAYLKDEFFVRAYPESYDKTVIEIYIPSLVRAERDNLNRVTLLENEDYRIEIVYDDEPGRDILSTPGNPDVPIWRFKKIILRGPEEGQEMTIENTGWMVRSDGKPLKKGGGNLINGLHFDGDPTYAEYQNRAESGNKMLKNFQQYQKEKKKKLLKEKKNKYRADYQTMAGLKGALNLINNNEQSNWINTVIKIIKDWWNGSSVSSIGSGGYYMYDIIRCRDFSDVVAPGNTNAQRLFLICKFPGEGSKIVSEEELEKLKEEREEKKHKERQDREKGQESLEELEKKLDEELEKDREERRKEWYK